MSVRDENNIPKLLKALHELEEYHVEIGIFGEDDTELLMIASVHEFGVRIKVTPAMRAYLHHIGIHLKKDTKHINIPERSYIRAGFDENVNSIKRQSEMLLDGVLSMRIDAKAYYEALGAVCVSAFQEFLTNLRDPPVHPVTEDRKGSSNPLINTQRLRQSITYKVVRG